MGNRKGKKMRTVPEYIIKKALLCIDKGQSYVSVAGKYGISKSVIEKAKQARKAGQPRLKLIKSTRMFTDQEEKALHQIVNELISKNMKVTKKDVCLLAYGLGKSRHLDDQMTNWKNMASVDWLRGFLTRTPKLCQLLSNKPRVVPIDILQQTLFQGSINPKLHHSNFSKPVGILQVQDDEADSMRPQESEIDHRRKDNLRPARANQTHNRSPNQPHSTDIVSQRPQACMSQLPMAAGHSQLNTTQQSTNLEAELVEFISELKQHGISLMHGDLEKLRSKTKMYLKQGIQHAKLIKPSGASSLESAKRNSNTTFITVPKGPRNSASFQETYRTKLNSPSTDGLIKPQVGTSPFVIKTSRQFELDEFLIEVKGRILDYQTGQAKSEQVDYKTGVKMGRLFYLGNSNGKTWFDAGNCNIAKAVQNTSKDPNCCFLLKTVLQHSLKRTCLFLVATRQIKSGEVLSCDFSKVQFRNRFDEPFLRIKN